MNEPSYDKTDVSFLCGTLCSWGKNMGVISMSCLESEIVDGMLLYEIDNVSQNCSFNWEKL